MSFSENLRQLIEDNDMTQRELASALNIAASTLGSYCQGTREPDFETLKLLAGYFETSTDYLLNYRTGKTHSHKEDELLRVFRSMTDDQKDIYITQGKAFIRTNRKDAARSSKLTS